MKKIIFALVALCAFVSCDETITEPDGYAEDTIKLERDDISLSAKNTSTSIHTDGDSWWITNDIKINGETYYLYSKDDEGVPNPAPDNHIEAEFSFDENMNIKEIVGFSTEWFTLTKSSDTEIRIEVEPNYTSLGNSAVITLQDGNYFGQLKVEQSTPTTNGMTFTEIYLECDDLTVGEAKALEEEIKENDTFTGFYYFTSDNMRFYRNNDINNYVEYSYKKDLNTEDLTQEERDILSSWDYSDIQILSYSIISNDTETLAMYITSTPVQTRLNSSPISYLNVDVTAKYKAKYPALDKAFVIYNN